jgi:hypothetical protein
MAIPLLQLIEASVANAEIKKKEKKLPKSIPSKVKPLFPIDIKQWILEEKPDYSQFSQKLKQLYLLPSERNTLRQFYFHNIIEKDPLYQRLSSREKEQLYSDVVKIPSWQSTIERVVNKIYEGAIGIPYQKRPYREDVPEKIGEIVGHIVGWLPFMRLFKVSKAKTAMQLVGRTLLTTETHERTKKALETAAAADIKRFATLEPEKVALMEVPFTAIGAKIAPYIAKIWHKNIKKSFDNLYNYIQQVLPEDHILRKLKRKELYDVVFMDDEKIEKGLKYWQEKKKAIGERKHLVIDKNLEKFNLLNTQKKEISKILESEEFKRATSGLIEGAIPPSPITRKRKKITKKTTKKIIKEIAKEKNIKITEKEIPKQTTAAIEKIDEIENLPMQERTSVISKKTAETIEIDPKIATKTQNLIKDASTLYPQADIIDEPTQLVIKLKSTAQEEIGTIRILKPTQKKVAPIDLGTEEFAATIDNKAFLKILEQINSMRPSRDFAVSPFETSLFFKFEGNQLKIFKLIDSTMGIIRTIDSPINITKELSEIYGLHPETLKSLYRTLLRIGGNNLHLSSYIKDGERIFYIGSNNFMFIFKPIEKVEKVYNVIQKRIFSYPEVKGWMVSGIELNRINNTIKKLISKEKIKNYAIGIEIEEATPTLKIEVIDVVTGEKLLKGQSFHINYTPIYFSTKNSFLNSLNYGSTETKFSMSGHIFDNLAKLYKIDTFAISTPIKDCIFTAHVNPTSYTSSFSSQKGFINPLVIGQLFKKLLSAKERERAYDILVGLVPELLKKHPITRKWLVQRNMQLPSSYIDLTEEHLGELALRQFKLSQLLKQIEKLPFPERERLFYLLQYPAQEPGVYTSIRKEAKELIAMIDKEQKELGFLRWTRFDKLTAEEVEEYKKIVEEVYKIADKLTPAQAAKIRSGKYTDRILNSWRRKNIINNEEYELLRKARTPIQRLFYHQQQIEMGEIAYLPHVYLGREDRTWLQQRFRIYRPTRLNLRQTLQRKDLTDEERKRLGLITDAHVAVSKLNQHLYDIAWGKIFQGIADNPEWTLSPEVVITLIGKRRKLPTELIYNGKKYILMTSQKIKGKPVFRLGALHRRYVLSDIADDINGIQKLVAETWGWTEKLTAGWKVIKVTWNVPTVIRNVYSNAVFAHILGDLPPWDIKTYLEAFNEYIKKGDFYQRALEHNALSGTWVGAEINAYLRKAIRGKGDTIISKLLNYPKALFKMPAELWQGVEQMFKLAVFIKQLKRNVTYHEAAQRAQAAIFNYDEVPLLIKEIRRRWWGLPFITWTTKSIPGLVRGLIRHPLLTLGYLSIPIMIEEAARQKYKLSQAELIAIYKSLPKWMQGIIGKPEETYNRVLSGYTFIGKDKEDYIFIDFGLSSPIGDIKEVLKLFKGEYIPFTDPYGMRFFNSFIPAALLAIFGGVETTGRSLYERTDVTMTDKLSKVIDYLWRTFTPTTLDFKSSLWEQTIGRNKEPEEKPYSNPYGKWCIADWLGIKTRKIDLQRNLIRELERSYNLYREAIRRSVEATTAAEAKKYEEKANSIWQKIEKLSKNLDEISKLGVLF